MVLVKSLSRGDSGLGSMNESELAEADVPIPSSMVENMRYEILPTDVSFQTVSFRCTALQC